MSDANKPRIIEEGPKPWSWAPSVREYLMLEDENQALKEDIKRTYLGAIDAEREVKALKAQVEGFLAALNQAKPGTFEPENNGPIQSGYFIEVSKLKKGGE